MRNPESPHDLRGLNRRRLLGLGAAGLAASLLPRRAVAGPGDPSAEQLRSELDGYAKDGLSRSFTLSGGTVLRHTGELIEGGGIRVEDGEIVDVGAGVSGGTDVGGRWIVPGFTDAGCMVGLYEIGLEKSTHDKDESSDAVTPDARVIDAYNPLSAVVGVTRAAGITSVLVHPQTSRLVPGQAALFHTAGLTPQQALARGPLAMVIGLGHAGTGGKGPKTRMGVSMRLREILDGIELPDEEAEDARGRRRKRRKKGKGDRVKPDDEIPPARRAWRELRRGNLPVIFVADRVDDILTALQLATDFELRAVVLGGAEAWLVADQLAEARVPVLLGPLTVQPGNFQHLHARYDNAAMLHEAGVKLAFRTGSAHFSRGLVTSAGVAVAHGLPWEAAIGALTANVGDIFRLKRHGQIARGAPANFFLSEGDPLQPRHRVTRLWIAGREASLDNRQRRLFRRFRELW